HRHRARPGSAVALGLLVLRHPLSPTLPSAGVRRAHLGRRVVAVRGSDVRARDRFRPSADFSARTTYHWVRGKVQTGHAFVREKASSTVAKSLLPSLMRSRACLRRIDQEPNAKLEVAMPIAIERTARDRPMLSTSPA